MKKTLLHRSTAWLCPVLLVVATAASYAQPSVTLTGVDPTCGGFSNGSITAVGSGGWGPYNFTFSNGATASNQTTATVSGLTAGTYSVTVVDMDLGIGTATITLNAAAGLMASVSQDDVCDDDNDNASGTNSSATASVSGGTPPYTYMWTDGQTTATATGLSPGLACVTIMDANACSVVECVNIVAPLSVSATASSVQCADFCDASVTATVSGGVAPYTYQWNTGATGEVLQNVGVGTYTVTVTDGNGCTATATATVTAPAPIMISVNVSNPSCSGGATGSATVMVVGGGGGPFTYEFSDGQTTQTAINLAPGSYSVTVRAANGCDATANFTISTSGNIQATVATTDATCADPNGGTATASASGGAGNYSYAWNTGANTPTITGLAAGTYSVTVTDNDTGCVAVAMGTVMSSDGPTITTSNMPVSCNGGTDGMAAVMVNGGTQPYTFSWNTGSDQPSISNVGAGTYTITVTDANGCDAVASTTVSEPDAIDLDVTGTSADCANAGASATATVSGGTAPYSYSWNTGATTPTISGITPGTYTVTVTDANGCTATGSVTIDGTGGSLSVSTTGSAVCAGTSTGTATATATGGSGNYGYAWSTGATTQSIGGLAAGSYTVTVTDNDTGCTGTATVTITESGSIAATASGSDFCENNAAGGSAIATGSMGSGNYSYAWNNGATTATISGLAAGTFTVTVTDNSTGCTATATATVSSNPAPTVAASIVTPLTTFGVNDGKVTAVGAGGTAPYTYSWSNGGNTQMIDGLGAGTYTVTLTDANGCTATDVVVLSGIAKVGGRTFEDVDNNGQRDAGDMGIPNVSVTLTGTDVDGNPVTLNTTTGADGTYQFDGLTPGTYKVTFGTSGTLSFTLANTGNDDTDSDAIAATGMTNTFTLNAGDCVLTVDAGYFDACDNFVTGGEICCDQVLCGPGNDPDPLVETVAPQGGSGPIQYLWMSSNVDAPFSVGTFTAIPGATNMNYDPGPLTETTYFVRCIRRGDDCPYIESNIIEVSVDGPDAASITGPTDICTGSTVTFTAGAVASATATYSWNFGLNATPATATTASGNVTFSTFGVRLVTLTVVTANCTSTATLLVNVSDNSPACTGNLQVLPVDVDLINSAAVRVAWERPANDFTYTVERSADGQLFEAIATLDHAMAPGQLESFAFVDEAPLPGHSFYRVYAMAGDRMAAQSDAMRISRFLGQQNLRVFPNPTTGRVIVDLAEEDFDTEVQVAILTPTGRILRSVTVAADAYRQALDLSDLPNGLYIVRFLYGTEGIQTLRITKK